MALPNKFLYFSTLAKFNNKKSQISKNTVSFIQETGQIYVDTSVGSAYFGGNSGVFAQKVHDSSTASTYGAGTANSFGHVKVSDTYTSNVGNAASSIAASQNAVYSVYTALTGVVNSKITSGNLNTINEHSLENSGTTSNWNYFTSILGTDASAGGILSVSDVQTKIQDSTHRLVTDASINAWNAKTSNTGTVTKVAVGTGLSVSPTSANNATYTVSPNLNSSASLGTLGTTNKLYAVGVDASGKLCVSVPWDDTVYTHPASSLGTKTISATTGKFIKSMSVDASGHVTALTDASIVLNDISTLKATTSAYGITQLSNSTSSTSTTLAATPSAVKAAYDLASTALATANSKTSNVGTVTQVNVSDGLTVSPTSANGANYTVSPNLDSTTSLGTIGTTSQLYAVGLDANKKLCVSVPWENTTYTHPASSLGTKTISATTGKFIKSMSVDASGHVTALTDASIVLNDISTLTATTSVYGITKLSSSTSSTSNVLAATPSAVKSAYDLASTALATANSKTSNVGTVTQVLAGVGLSVTGTAANAANYTVRAKLKSDSCLGTIGTTSKLYAVGVDSSGNLGVSVPWDNTVYTHPASSLGTKTITYTAGKALRSISVDASGHVTAVDTSSLGLVDISTIKANTSNYGIVKMSDTSTDTSTGLVPTSHALSLVQARAEAAYALADGKTSNVGTVTQVLVGDGLTVSGTAANAATYTVSPNLNSATSLGTIGTTSKLYAVGIDNNKKLCVSVPWDNTVYTHPASSLGTKTISATVGKFIKSISVDASGHVTAVDSSAIVLNDISTLTATTSAYGITKLYNGVDSTSNVLAATPNAVKTAYDLASTALATANQTVSLTGDVTGSGTTSITTTIGAGKVTNAMLATYTDASTDISTANTKVVSTKAVANYAVNKAGDTMTGDLILAKTATATGMVSPGLIFQRGTASDGYTDWKIEGGGSSIDIYSKTSGNWTKATSISTAGVYTGDITGNAPTATTATKLGTANKGDASTFIYLSAGAPAVTTKLTNSAWITAGAAAGNIPLIGTALGSTNNNIVVTDANGKLKPSGTVIGAAAGKSVIDASSNITSSATGLTTGKAVYDYVIDLQKAFKYESTVASDASLASTAPKGSVYFASAGFTLSAAKSSTGAAQTIEKGDMIVGNGSKWDVIQANWTAADGSASLTWGSAVTLATIGGVTIDAQLPPDPLSLSTFTNTVRYKDSSTATSGTITLLPNHFYVFSTAWNGTTVTIARAAEVTSGSAAIVNEYAGRFTTGATAPTVTFTNVSKWNEDKPTIEASSEYEFSIVDDRGILTKLKTF